MKNSGSKSIRRYLIAGLLVWIPVWATFLVLKFAVDTLDKTVDLIPKAYQPEVLFGIHIPGLGVLITLLALFITGMVATNFFGQKLLALGERILARIPLVRSIHQAVKQVMETIFSSNSQAFRNVLLVEYPRKGLWSIAFQTSNAAPIINQQLGSEHLAVFIPTTPNPTSGFLMMVNKENAIDLDISVDDALKMVISLGVMQPFDSVSQAQKAVDM